MGVKFENIHHFLKKKKALKNNSVETIYIYNNDINGDNQIYNKRYCVYKTRNVFDIEFDKKCDCTI